MTKKTKYLVGFFLILGALVYLLSGTFQSSLQYYVSVSELYAAQQTYQDKILKVAGKAAHIEKIEKESGLSQYRFHVLEGGKDLLVSYTGFAPDTFREDSDVVVTGSFHEDGTFMATEILAKCASKYEAKVKP